MKSLIWTIGMLALIPGTSFARGHDGAREFRTALIQETSDCESSNCKKPNTTEPEAVAQPQEETFSRRFVERDPGGRR
jgi:hypothetical protein